MRAAPPLNLMEEAVQGRQKADKLNVELLASEGRYRTLFEVAPVAVYSCDASGVIREFNRRAGELWGRVPVLGDTDERFCGSFRMIRPDGSVLAHKLCPMAEVLSGAVPYARDAEVDIERPDGSRVTVIVNIRPLKNEQGEITGAINCFYDITEQRAMDNQIRQQAARLADDSRRKDEFLAMLSHELRNPLASIVNAIQLLRLQNDRNPIQIQAHGIIDRQVAQLAHLVDDLLEVSRISTGRIHLSLERVDLRGTIRRAIETIQPQARRKEHSVADSLPDEPVWVEGDPMRLEQVVVNLLINAVKYTDTGGDIRLALQREGNEAILRVRDNGVGIAPEMLPRIFDLFTQADQSLDRAQGGLGIGLALVQSLVTLHRGRVEAKSTLGEGSEFTVALPLLESQHPFVVRIAAETPTAIHALKVLVVDDNKDAADTVSMLLQMLGHDARLAHDGKEALRVALDYCPDVVLLDIGLPGADGFQVAKWIRREPALNAVVLVALTGYGQESDRHLSQEAEFDHHLVKPVEFAKIEAILAAAVK